MLNKYKKLSHFHTMFMKWTTMVHFGRKGVFFIPSKKVRTDRCGFLSWRHQLFCWNLCWKDWTMVYTTHWWKHGFCCVSVIMYLENQKRLIRLYWLTLTLSSKISQESQKSSILIVFYQIKTKNNTKMCQLSCQSPPNCWILEMRFKSAHFITTVWWMSTNIPAEFCNSLMVSSIHAHDKMLEWKTHPIKISGT